MGEVGVKREREREREREFFIAAQARTLCEKKREVVPPYNRR